jgi:hypothetical protein
MQGFGVIDKPDIYLLERSPVAVSCQHRGESLCRDRL